MSPGIWGSFRQQYQGQSLAAVPRGWPGAGDGGLESAPREPRAWEGSAASTFLQPHDLM